MLEAKADYQAVDPENVPLTLSAKDTAALSPSPERIPPRVVHVWMHARETPEHEYFWGAWISVVVSGEEWGVNFKGARP